MDFSYSDQVRGRQECCGAYPDWHRDPAEAVFVKRSPCSRHAGSPGQSSATSEALKREARAQGLWNLAASR